MEEVTVNTKNDALKRRDFLRYAGAGAAIATLTVAGCKKTHDEPDVDDGEYFGAGISVY